MNILKRIFNPKIAAVVALGIGMATQGWGTALAGSLGLTGTAAIAVEAGVATLCSKAGMSMLQNNLDPVQTAKDVGRKETLLNVLESMATAGLTAGITIAIPGGASAAQIQVMKEEVDYGLTENSRHLN